jgi:threo-3-hydroxy-L-aspartate ammonia-lyase
VLERAKTVIEPSAAVGVAVALYKPLPHPAERVGVVLCGGNIDPDLIPSYLALAKKGANL